MADAFMYQAELFCRDCGEHLRSVLQPAEDSNDYPQGPYADGGGEADTPQHCGDCGEFLRNPLTPDGVACVRRKLTEWESTGVGRDIILREWRDFYQVESHYAEEEDCEPLTEREAAELAPQWGSYMTSADPGAIMYSAVPPEKPEHRDAMVRHIRGKLYPIAEEGEDSDNLRRLVRYLLDLPYNVAEAD